MNKDVLHLKASLLCGELGKLIQKLPTNSDEQRLVLRTVGELGSFCDEIDWVFQAVESDG